MPVIYLDVLIVTNWFIDYLLLSLTARLTHRPVRRWRLVVGAGIGGVSACQILLETSAAVTVLLHIVSAVCIIRTAFAWHSAKAFLRSVVVFLCVSALLSGVVSALWYVSGSEVMLTHSGVIYFDISPVALTVFSLIAYGVVRLYERLTRRRTPQGLEYVVTVEEGENTYELRALYDTGLHLKEPFSGVPVIVAKRTALQTALPTGGDEPLMASAARLRLVPYRTVGGEGLLPAFAPKRVTVRSLGDSPRDISGVYIALSDTLERGDYTALIGSDIVTL